RHRSPQHNRLCCSSRAGVGRARLTAKREALRRAGDCATIRPMSAPLLTAHVGATRLEICVADITTLDVEAIFNPPNRTLLPTPPGRGGGGGRHPPARGPGTPAGVSAPHGL